MNSYSKSSTIVSWVNIVELHVVAMMMSMSFVLLLKPILSIFLSLSLPRMPAWLLTRSNFGVNPNGDTFFGASNYIL